MPLLDTLPLSNGGHAMADAAPPAPAKRAAPSNGAPGGPAAVQHSNGGANVAARAAAPPPVVDSVLDLIGATPMLRVTRFDTGPCQLFIKLENVNPGGEAG
jgi:cystathionine beta-synthase